MIKEVKPDIAIVTTMSLIADVEEALMLCAKHGINAITTCEEAFYPKNSNPSVTRKLDEMAKSTNCTINRKWISRYILGTINFKYCRFNT